METDIREVNFSKWQNYNKISLDWFLNVLHCTETILPISSKANVVFSHVFHTSFFQVCNSMS